MEASMYERQKAEIELMIVDALVDAIRPVFAGREPELISAVLADLLATLIAGHSYGDRKRTDELREEILRMHIEHVRKLIPINEEEILEREAAHATRQ
jgi:hypothetical protein